MKHMTKRVLAVALSGVLCGTVLLTQGCDNPEKDKGGGGGGDAKVDTSGGERIGIIDTVKVAEQLGWAEKRNDGMQKLKAQLEGDAKAMSAQVTDALTKELDKDGVKAAELRDKFDKLAPDQKQRILTLQQQIQQLQYNLNQAAQQVTQAYSARWDEKYSRALTPMIRKVATNKKLVAVMAAQTVIWKDPAVDISDAVIDVAHAEQAKVEEVEMPGHIQLDPNTFSPTTNPTTAPAK